MRKDIISTVSKGQMVIPKAVQDRMGLKPGDRVCYHVKGSKVEIEKITRAEDANPFFAFTEWSSDADEKAFGHLKPKRQ